MEERQRELRRKALALCEGECFVVLIIKIQHFLKISHSDIFLNPIFSASFCDAIFFE